MPRISINDCEENFEMLREFVLLDDDEALKDVNVVNGAAKILDRDHEFKLSGQQLASERTRWARWECDKTRLLWSFFLRNFFFVFFFLLSFLLFEDLFF